MKRIFCLHPEKTVNIVLETENIPTKTETKLNVVVMNVIIIYNASMNKNPEQKTAFATKAKAVGILTK